MNGSCKSSGPFTGFCCHILTVPRALRCTFHNPARELLLPPFADKETALERLWLSN